MMYHYLNNNFYNIHKCIMYIMIVTQEFTDAEKSTYSWGRIRRR
jgi:hypothetical protein